MTVLPGSHVLGGTNILVVGFCLEEFEREPQNVEPGKDILPESTHKSSA